MADANLEINHTIDSFNLPIIENCILVWLDANRDPNDTVFKSTLIRLQQLINLILIFSDVDQCFDFLTDVKNERIFLIVSDNFGQQLISLMTSLCQIDSIYIYCKDRTRNEKWALKEKKIRGIFTKFEPIYDAIRRDLRQCEDDLIPFSILSSTYHQQKDSDQLFIYTQLMKTILLGMEDHPKLNLEFIHFCHLTYLKNVHQSILIEKFRREYQPTSAIRWYIDEYFIYAMLNKAFRIQNMDLLIKMKFFIRDLQKEIQQRHGKLNKPNRLIVYRGQGITDEVFQNILENINGFLSFNNFLVATTDKEKSLAYARSARVDLGMKGVLFHMEIDRTIAIFTPLDKISDYSDSDTELLFSTHTIFRIHSVQEENGLMQIQLKLTMNEEKDLQDVQRFLQKEIEDKNESQEIEMKIEQPAEKDMQQEEAVESMPTEEIKDTTEEQFSNPLQHSSDS